jgi:DNA-directed RNA polymerase specialized sigma24 family protein
MIALTISAARRGVSRAPVGSDCPGTPGPGEGCRRRRPWLANGACAMVEGCGRCATYPRQTSTSTCPRAVAANVVLDVLMGTRRRRQRSDPVAVSGLPLDDFEQRPSDSSARDRLDAVVEAGTLREGDVAVVTDALGRRVPLGEAARRASCSPRAMKDRRWRARRRVAAAMHASA